MRERRWGICSWKKDTLTAAGGRGGACVSTSGALPSLSSKSEPIRGFPGSTWSFEGKAGGKGGGQVAPTMWREGMCTRALRQCGQVSGQLFRRHVAEFLTGLFALFFSRAVSKMDKKTNKTKWAHTTYVD